MNQNMINGCLLINTTFIPFLVYIMFLQKTPTQVIRSFMFISLTFFITFYISVVLCNYPLILLITNLVTMCFIVKYYVFDNDDDDDDDDDDE